jgi:hypothetical protein
MKRQTQWTLESQIVQFRPAGSRALQVHPSSLLLSLGLTVQKPRKLSFKIERFSLLMTPTVFL